MLATRNTQQVLNIYWRGHESSQIGMWTCFYQMMVVAGLCNLQFDQTVCCAGIGGSAHSAIVKKFCTEDMVHVLRATGQSALVSRRCLWPLMF